MSTNISVLGLGYLGVTHAVTMAKLGHSVVGFDPQMERVESLSLGNLPFYEPGLEDLLKEMLETGRLEFTTSLGSWVNDVEAHFICVGTPAAEQSDNVDLSQLESAISELAPLMSPSSIAVGRSTAPVGTAAKVRELGSRVAKRTIRLAWNPEFLSEGTALRDSLSPSRIVVGTSDSHSEAVLRNVYAPLIEAGIPYLSLSLETSELVKVASNSFLALKISFINGVASIAEKAGASTIDLASALGLDPRISPAFLRNGLGFGGGCLPKDLLGFAFQARQSDKQAFAELLESAYQVNRERIFSTIEIIEQRFLVKPGARLTLLGASFKPGTDDIRDSQSLKLLNELNKAGYETTVHDPVALDGVLKVMPFQKIERNIVDALRDADCVVLGTDWVHYSQLDPYEIGKTVKMKNILDARGCLDRSRWTKAGWKLISLGESLTN